MGLLLQAYCAAHVPQIKVRNSKGAGMQVLPTTEVVLLTPCCVVACVCTWGICEGQVLGGPQYGVLSCVRCSVVQAAVFVTRCTACWRVHGSRQLRVATAASVGWAVGQG